MGNKGVKGFGKGFAKQQRKFNREIAKQKRYRREDLRRIRKFEKGAEKGKNVRYVSPFNKEQQKLMRELPKKYLERAAKGKLNIKKDPLYKSGQKYIKEGLKEKFPKKAPKISKKDMEAMKQLSLKEFKESFVPALASRFGGGKYGSGALNLALAKAGKDLQQQFDAMNYQRKAGNIDIAQRHQQIREVMKGRQQDLLGKGLMMAQAPIENAQNMAQLGLSQAPNQPYFLNPPVLKSALMQGRQPSPMPPVMGQPYQPQQFQKQPGFFQQAAAGLAGGLGQAAGMWGMNQLFGQPAAAAAGAQRMDMGGFNNMGAPQRQDIGGFNNLGPIELS